MKQRNRTWFDADEEVYLNAYANVREAWAGAGRWLRFYNLERSHPALGYRPPTWRSTELGALPSWRPDSMGAASAAAQALDRHSPTTHHSSLTIGRRAKMELRERVLLITPAPEPRTALGFFPSPGEQGGLGNPGPV